MLNETSTLLSRQCETGGRFKLRFETLPVSSAVINVLSPEPYEPLQEANWLACTTTDAVNRCTLLQHVTKTLMHWFEKITQQNNINKVD